MLSETARQKMYRTLSEVFGFSNFRTGQQEVVESILSGEDTVALFPTGNGKSLCYQLAGLCLPHLTLVLSPLLALMQDQVEALRRKGIAAASWTSQSSWSEKRALFSALSNQELRFLYLSPEKLLSPASLKFLLQQKISQIVVDEAHCISQWSYEFRPQYGQITRFLQQYEKNQTRPIVNAFTATATQSACDDMLRLLALREPNIVALPFSRPNLRYCFLTVPSEAIKRSLLLRYLAWWKETVGGSALVYAATRRETEWLAEWLQLFGFPAQAFHAGLASAEKQHLLRNFLENERSLLICTSAFGMGVDKPNVRVVLHHTPPCSLEAYTQEAGRAGRDGKTAWPILLYSATDLERNFLFTVSSVKRSSRRRFLHKQALAVSRLAESSTCIGKSLARYFWLPGTRFAGRLECHCSRCRKGQPERIFRQGWQKEGESNLGQLTSLQKQRQERTRKLRLSPSLLGQKKTMRKLAEHSCMTEKEVRATVGAAFPRFRWLTHAKAMP